jgi:alkylation response protein AidB-like acyl-CoA dehydrogenase
MFGGKCPFGHKPSDPFKEKREAGPVARYEFQGEQIPMILRHADVRQAAKDWQTYSSDAPFRVLCASFGGGLYVNQMVTARALLHDVASTWSNDPAARLTLGPRIAAAKYAATNAAVVATDHALRAAGGFGITRDLPLERFFRDARAGLTHPPNDDAALEMVGRSLTQ